MMPHYTVQDVASKIDHAVLKPNQTETDVQDQAALCIRRGVASLCVRPCDVPLATRLLQGSSVKVSCVLSFPHGADTPASKIVQATQAIDGGVDEIDMVMNIGQFLSGNFARVRTEIQAVVDTAHTHGVLVKVIQESAFLSLEQVAVACTLAHEAGADFVKTSTGFGPSSATPEIIAVMIDTVGGKMGIKASGGIRTWAQAVGYLEQGATRLGIGDTAAVLDGSPARLGY